MADKTIAELIAATMIDATDMFPFEQNGTAKKLPGQVLLNWLTAAADGHGGIQSIAKISTSGLTDTYRITLADTTTFDFAVTNGRGIGKIEKTSTSGLVDTYTITYNDGTTGTFAVTNGAKGEQGDNTYTWIKYASQEPTAESHSFGDVPDDWIGIYYGTLSAAPEDWTLYTWYQIKGNQGDPGTPATLTRATVTYQASESGTIVPSGDWSAVIPSVAQGQYLWTRTESVFNTGSPVVAYAVSRMGIDGLGSVVSVGGVSPDGNGNVDLIPSDIGAVAYTTGNKLDNSNFTQFVAQAGIGGSHGNQAYAGDRWILDSGTVTGTANANGNGYSGITLNGTIRQIVADPPAVGTVAVEMVSGTATISYAAGAVTITSSGGVIKNAALYDGEYTSAVVPQYQPKGYGAELAECERYYLHSGTTAAWDVAHATGNNYLVFAVATPVTMRAKPSIVTNAAGTKIYNSGWKDLDLSAFGVNYHAGSVLLQASADKLTDLTLTAGMSYLINFLPSLAADL